jgi:hypothetical protein
MSYASFRKTNAYAIMKALVMACFAVLVAGCQAPQSNCQPLVYSGGDGSSCEQAVVIREARYRETGRLAEHLWLDQKYPGYRDLKQSALDSGNRRYDLVEFATAEGETRKVYFDTTDFFNR